jgi:hypothetical protein
MIYELGGLVGWLTGLFFGLTLLSFLLKWYSRRQAQFLERHEDFRKKFRVVLRFFVRNHRYLAFVAVLALVIHYIIQYMNFGYVPLTGWIAGSALVLQVAWGVIGQYILKKKTGIWHQIHRVLAAILTLSILAHVFFKI